MSQHSASSASRCRNEDDETHQRAQRREQAGLHEQLGVVATSGEAHAHDPRAPDLSGMAYVHLYIRGLSVTYLPTLHFAHGTNRLALRLRARSVGSRPLASYTISEITSAVCLDSADRVRIQCCLTWLKKRDVVTVIHARMQHFHSRSMAPLE